jgi:4-hydroxy-tetrahydrodipicolinate synthase
MMNPAFGSCTALITPFKNGKLDEAAYANLIKRQIRLGIDTVSPMGTTGESPTVTHDEHKRCIEIAIECAKGTGAKVLAGAGSNSTAEAVDLAKFAANAGADGVLVITPYYNKPTQEGLFLHYQAIANAVDVGVMLYNVPGRCAVDLKPLTVKQIADACPNVYAIKEASGSMERCVELGVLTPNISIFSGDDGINYPILANGGKGVVSVTSNLLPNKLKEMTDAAAKGDYLTAKKINDELYAINSVLFVETNPIPIKAAMYLAGLIENLEFRLPLTNPSVETMKKLEAALQKYEILK